jgi:biopolymer transport protein TolR
MLRPKPATPPEAHGAPGELNVVPFLDILLNVLMFVLATIAVTFTTRLDASLASKGSPIGSRSEGLALTVAVLQDGFVVSARGQRMAEGCEVVGAGLAVGRTVEGERDYDGLTSCVRRLKAAAPEGDREVVITAANDIRYDAIIRTVDAMRGGAEEELFPDVSFAVPR